MSASLSEGTAPFGISNEGFRGMGVRQGEAYDFSAQIRGVDGSPVLRVQLYGGDGTLLDSAELQNFSADWKKYTATLHPKDTDAKARLAIVMDGKGTVDLDMISLFPGAHLEKSPRRFARRHGAGAGGFASGLPAFPRRLHRRRQRA